MKRFLALVMAILAIVTSTWALAGTPYNIHWQFTEENPICEEAHLARNGGAYFDVNNTPIPTFEVPGAFMTLANGSQSNIAEAGFDSILLRTGANEFAFGASNSSGNNSCIQSSNVVTLRSTII